MAEVALEQPPVQATDVKTEQATEIGTTAPDVSVQQEARGDSEAKPEDSSSERAPAGESGDSDLKYSEATLAARVESVKLDTAAEAVKGERDRQKEQRERFGRDFNAVFREAQRLAAEAVDDSESDPDTKNQLKQINSKYKDALETAALNKAASVYKDEAELALKEFGLTDKEMPSFWERVGDPLYAADVIREAINTVALKADAVRRADPQALIDANPKLKAHISEFGDQRFGEGRGQGRKDPPPENRVDSTSSNSSMTAARLFSAQMPSDEYQAFKREHPEEFARLSRGG